MTVLRLVGISPRLLMLGFMIPTALLSMWIRLNSSIICKYSTYECIKSITNATLTFSTS